jgi:hypothetical protein
MDKSTLQKISVEQIIRRKNGETMRIPTALMEPARPMSGKEFAAGRTSYQVFHANMN